MKSPAAVCIDMIVDVITGVGRPSVPYVVESEVIADVEPPGAWNVESGTTGVEIPSIPVVNTIEAEEVNPPTIASPCESVKAVFEDRGSIPEPDNEVTVLDKPDPGG